MYDFAQMLGFSALSYDNFQPFDGSDRLISVNCNKSGIQYYIRIIGDVLCITFRGTDSLKDILSDSRFFRNKLPFCNPDGRVKIHRGFLNAYMSPGIYDRIHSYITDEIREIYICGHSLGGALSLVCGYDLFCLFPQKKYHITVFGCPRIGNLAFKNEFNRFLPDTLRIENGNDIVTKIPPAVFGFHHVGNLRHTGKARIYGIYSIADHSVSEYIKNSVIQ